MYVKSSELNREQLLRDTWKRQQSEVQSHDPLGLQELVQLVDLDSGPEHFIPATAFTQCSYIASYLELGSGNLIYIFNPLFLHSIWDILDLISVWVNSTQSVIYDILQFSET